MVHTTTGLTTQPGDRVNLLDSASLRWWEGPALDDLTVHELLPDEEGNLLPVWVSEAHAWHLGLEWESVRDVRQVAVTYAGAMPPRLEVQYWQRNWPTCAPERRAGARRGWIGQDDPWHGHWVTVRAAQVIEDRTCILTFDPVDLPELRSHMTWDMLEEAEDYLAPFRRTLKVRLVSYGPDQPVIEYLNVVSAARWQAGDVDIWFGASKVKATDWSGFVTATNGILTGIEALDFGPTDVINPSDAATLNTTWTCHVKDAPKGVRVHLLYTVDAALPAAGTILTLKTTARSFSFLMADLARGPIVIPDYHVAVVWSDAPRPNLDHVATSGAGLRSIYERVPDEPEHSLARVIAEVPSLDVTKQDSGTGLGRYLPLSLETGRQEFAVRHNGELFVDKTVLKLSGRDASRLLWPGRRMRLRFGSGDPPDFREVGHTTRQSLLEGWLPVVISRWQDREITYEEMAFVAPIEGPVNPPASRGDEDVAALIRFEMRNTTHGRKTVQLWLNIDPQESLTLEEGRFLVAQGRVVPDVAVARQWRVDSYPEPRLRCCIEAGERSIVRVIPSGENPAASHVVPTSLLYSVDLDGGESHTLQLTVPFATPGDAAAWRRLAALDFDAALTDVVATWRTYIESGGQIDLPEHLLSDFHKSARVHVGISADKDPVTGLSVVPAATWSYGACGNEACWQITMLDQAGHHNRAAAYLETFLSTQGLTCPDGRFGSSDGALVSMDFDAGEPVMGGFAYNLDQGVIMECLADHYRYTGDGEWLARVAPNLVAACDFVIRERARTKIPAADGTRSAAWGLLPAGHLEDNPEWRHWFAVNAHAYAGLRAIADILTEIAHPDAERLPADAAAYREDIRAAAHRAMIESPVVQLLDGTYVPHIPTRTGIRGRERGWFREAAYGALHLLEGGVYDPSEDEMTWVLKDLEDNLFVSREWGRPVDLDAAWFSHGGATIQPNLTDLAIDYLRRGEIKHALRALYNNFGVSLYPDVRAFAEHPVVELGHGVGPFYKSSDESKALIWLRHCLLHEEGRTLHIAMGAPRAWFVSGQSFAVHKMATFFGPVSYAVRSSSDGYTIDISLDTARRPEALVVHLRGPQGSATRTVTVNGELQGEASWCDDVITLPAPPQHLVIEVSYAIHD